MASSLSNLVKGISEEIHKRKYKYWHDDKNFGITYEVCHCFLEYKNFRDDLIEHIYAVTKRINKFDEKLKEQFLNSHKCSNCDNNKFILLLQKVFCPYEYVADWKDLNETSLPEKEDFYIHLNVEDITDADYVHAKRVSKKFMICMCIKIHYCQLVHIRNISFEIYELDPPKKFPAPGLAWQRALEKTKVKEDLLTDVGM